MKILHAPFDIAGQAGLSAYGQRELGHLARAFFAPHPFGYEIQPDFYLRSHNPVLRRLEILRNVLAFPMRYEVFHFHFGSTFLRDSYRFADARLFRRLGRRVFVEFFGSDIRQPSLEARRNPYYVNSYEEDDRVSGERLRRWAEITQGHVIFSDHSFDDLFRPYFPHIHVVGQRVDTQRFVPLYPDPCTRVPLIVHAPSQKAFKGTEVVQKAVERLKARKLPFEYVEVHGLSQREAIEMYRRADLVIDQLRAGSHGVFAAEAMSLGKPVICYILPELVSTFPPGFPIINANPDTIEAVLEEWIQRPGDRHRLGIQSRQYAERVHDCRVVARKLIAAYEGQS